jgi:hypothetical protein
MYMKTKDKYKKVARPLTRLATLATLSPRERAVDDVGFQHARIEGTKRECI